jgi:hypothetical protein
MNNREQSVINLVINGQQAQTSLREVSGTVNALRSELSRMRREDNPQQYEQRIQLLRQMTAAQSALRQEIFQTGEESKSFWDKMSGSAGVAVGNMIADGFQAALGAVTNFIDGSEAAYIEAVKGQAQITAALRSTKGVAGETKEALSDMSGALMDQTGIDDDVISKGEEMLLTFTNVRGKIYDQALPAIVDMTSALNGGSVSMEAIQGQAIQVGKALNDPIKGMAALAKVGVTFDDQQKEQIKKLVESNHLMDAQAIILNELKKEFGGVAKTIADTDVGAYEKYQTRLGNIQESIGNWITKGKLLSSQVLEPFVGWLEKATTTSLPDKLREEQTEMNALVGAIVSTNDNQAVRNRLIGELQEKYPDFLGNIKAENVQTDMLLRRLQAVNDQYRDRIFIAANEDKIKVIQEARNKAVREEADARERVAKASGLNATQLAKMSEQDIRNMAARQLQEQRNLSRLSTGMGTSGANSGSYWENKAMADVDLIINGRKRLEKSYKEEADLMGANAVYQDKVTKQQLADIDKEIAALQKRKAAEKDAGRLANITSEIERLQKQKKDLLGIIDNPVSGPTAAVTKKKADEVKAFHQKVKDTLASVDSLVASATKGTADNLDAQLQVISNKYQKLIDQLKELSGNKNASAADRKKGAAAINDLAHARDEETQHAKDAFSYNSMEKMVNDDTQKQKNENNESELSPEDKAAKEYEIEQKRLEDLYYIRQLYGMDTLDLETNLANGKIANDKRVHDAHMDYLKKQTKGEQEYQKFQQMIAAQKAEIAEGGLQLLTTIFGRSKVLMLAQLAYEKAIAIGRIIAQEGVEIAGYYAHYAAGGIVGVGIASALSVAAKIRAGLSIANVIASGVIQAASSTGGDSGGKKFALGGFAPEGPSHSGGGLKLVNPYGAILGEMEGGEPILSRSTYANNRGLVDALMSSGGRQLNMNRIQDATYNRERRLSNLSYANDDRTAAAAAGKSTADHASLAMLDQLVALTDAVQNQKVILSNREFEDFQNRRLQIKDEANA